MGDRNTPNQPTGAGKAGANVAPWLLLCAAALAVVLFATDTGVGVSPDSTAYIGTARGVLSRFGLGPVAGAVINGRGFGPLYPALLIGVGTLLQVDPFVAARWLDAMVLPVNLVLMGALARRAVPAARWLPWLAGLLFLCSPDLLTIHTMAWTEPPFLGLVLLGAYLLDVQFGSPSRRGAMLVMLAAAAACLDRFAGLAFVLAAGTAWLLWGHGRVPQRVVAVALTGLLAVLPLLVWLRLKPGFQSFAFHSPSPGYLVQAWSTVSRWIVPEFAPLPSEARGAIALLVIVICAVLVATPRVWGPVMRRPPMRSRIGGILILFAGAYCVILALTAFFWDAGTMPDGRILAPLLVTLIVPALTALRSAYFRRGPGARAILGAAGIGWLLVASGAAGQWIGVTHAQGQGYTSVAWRTSGIMAAVRLLPKDITLVSNGNDAITFLTGRQTVRIPDRVNGATLVPNANYPAAMAVIRQRLENDAVLVFVGRLGERWYIPSEAALVRELNLEPVVRADDGAIYRVRGGGPPLAQADTQ